METEKLFLIVLGRTKNTSVEEQLEEKGWLAELQSGLRALGNIRLYNLPDKKEGKKPLVALPFGGGKTLLLTRNVNRISGGDYFTCIGGAKFPRPSASTPCHELRGDVEIRIVDDKKVHHYLNDAVDCSKIDFAVQAEKPWRPYEDAEAEAKKWKAYLDLFKKMLDGSRFGLPVARFQLCGNGKFADVSLDLSGIPEGVEKSEINKKIENARNESVHFALTADTVEAPNRRYRKSELGKLKAVAGDVVQIELAEGFAEALQEQIKQGEFYLSDSTTKPAASGDDKNRPRLVKMGKFLDFVKPQNDGQATAADGDSAAETENEYGVLPFEFAKLDGRRETDVYYSENGEKSEKAFSCRAEKTTDVWRIDPGNIALHRFMVFADFVGDFYQVRVMQDGMKKIREHPVWDVLAGERVAKLPQVENIQWDADCRLNDEQKNAVKKALGAPELCLIWGPPGTGKTEVISEIARQEAKRGHKVLISSQANLAVDNALARLHGEDGVWTFRQIKEKHDLEKEDEAKVPTRKTAHRFFAQWLRKRLAASDGADFVVADLRKKLTARLKKKARNGRDDAQMASLYRKRINVVGATLMETGKSEKIKDTKRNKLCHDTGVNEFDTVIIDEVSKALPPELFLPILLGKRVVLVGDHKQLPPTFKMPNGDDLALDEWAEKAEVPREEVDPEKTIFERLWDKHTGDASDVRAMMTKQYRMHPRIQRLIEPFYTDEEGRLECGLSEEEQRNMVIPHARCFAGRHAVWVDTDNSALEASEGTSYVNNDEIILVGKILESLPHNDGMSVGVITFYGAQLRRLRNIYESKYAQKFPGGKLIFGTVDRFQGRECDVVICSLVRKNKKGRVGFAVKPNRINVAFSRARKLLCIVGNSGHFCYESKKRDARQTYKEVYQKCELMHKGDLDG